jgi:hypothetical protein
MKKPAVDETDKLRTLTEDPELRALMEQYLAAAREDSGPILEALNVKAEARYPGWQEIIERSHRDGVYLRAHVIGCVKRIRARSDLSDFERSHAEDAEAEFNMIFKRAQRDGFLSKEDAFMLVESAQRLIEAAGLEPEDAERLRRQALIDRMRETGKIRRKKNLVLVREDVGAQNPRDRSRPLEQSGRRHALGRLGEGEARRVGGGEAGSSAIRYATGLRSQAANRRNVPTPTRSHPATSRLI